jgi:hypothetical protein
LCGINGVAPVVDDGYQGALELLIIDIAAVRQEAVGNKVHDLHVEVLRGLHYIFHHCFVMLHNQLRVEQQSFADQSQNASPHHLLDLWLLQGLGADQSWVHDGEL